MDRQSSQNELQLMSLDFGGNDYGVSQLAENHPYQNYFLEDGSDGFNYMSPPLPQWIRCQQNTPKYVEFLAENGVSELQVDISHSNISSMTCSFQHTVPFLDMNVKQAIHPRLHNESPINNFTGAQHQISVHTENSNDGHCNASQPHSSALPPKPHRKVLSRKRAYASDRLRRLRIAERLNALQELLPQSKEGDKATVLDDIINLLQEQIKVQSMEHAHNCLLPMGITSENVANRYGVTRQDQAAVDSHRKVAAVTASGKFKEEIVPVHTKEILAK